MSLCSFDQWSNFIRWNEKHSDFLYPCSDDPIVIAILDGKTLKVFLEDEDDFAMLAENLFTDLDIEDRGKIKRKQIRDALFHMGVEMGIPPLSGLLLSSPIKSIKTLFIL